MTTITFTDLRTALFKLGLSHTPVIAHASLKSFGEVVGGADAVLRALLDSVWALVMPTFTYATMVTPQVGPPNNGIRYGSEQDLNRMAEPFSRDMPADKQMGIIPETLRLHPRARRSIHPIQSFAGIYAEKFLAAQTMQEPLGPIRALAEAEGWALLLGVDHTVNTSIHYAEVLAGRRTFTRWAVIADRIVECPGFPGDSAGFDAITPYVAGITRRVKAGSAYVQAMPLRGLIQIVTERIKADPLALLCNRPDCMRCNAVRDSVAADVANGSQVQVPQ
ncbi:MAG TPA: AAC(3) family N-acetyltransferase [Anaerolineales bacterium]|nr:AAC(3) family N-acetyltransferase [Anaerolineales bacterium]